MIKVTQLISKASEGIILFSVQYFVDLLTVTYLFGI